MYFGVLYNLFITLKGIYRNHCRLEYPLLLTLAVFYGPAFGGLSLDMDTSPGGIHDGWEHDFRDWTVTWI